MLKQRYGYSRDDVVIVFTGRFVKRKGIDLLLNAFAGLIQNSKNPVISRAKLCLVGSDELQQHSLMNIIQQAKERYPDLIRTVNPGIRVVEYLHFADIFVFPSKREGMPNSVIEAFAVGLPCVLSNIAPNMELANANPSLHTRFFISGEVSSLQETLECAIREVTVRLDDGFNANAGIDSKFKIENVTLAYVSLYEKLLFIRQHKYEGKVL
jgi:glycosyltransferase involved in cell wall biosynthesis